jgi:hypothetical protein
VCTAHNKSNCVVEAGCYFIFFFAIFHFGRVKKIVIRQYADFVLKNCHMLLWL